MKIILGQGNPGDNYRKNRHNIGFMVLEHFAIEKQVEFKTSKLFKSQIAELNYDNQAVILIKPDCYYNNTGEVAQKLVHYYKIDTSQDLMVIHDELMLPFGAIRTRNGGRDAGNNGIKSINQHIGLNYHRFRIGIKNDLTEKMPAEDFVLKNFTKDELIVINNQIIPHTIDAILNFISGKPEITSKKFEQ